MFGSDCYSIKEHKDDDEPVEPLCFDCMSDPKSETFFSSPEALAASWRFDFRLEETCWKLKLQRKNRENSGKRMERNISFQLDTE